MFVSEHEGIKQIVLTRWMTEEPNAHQASWTYWPSFHGDLRCVGTGSEDTAPHLSVFVNEHEGMRHIMVTQVDSGGAKCSPTWFDNIELFFLRTHVWEAREQTAKLEQPTWCACRWA